MESREIFGAFKFAAHAPSSESLGQEMQYHSRKLG